MLKEEVYKEATKKFQAPGAAYKILGDKNSWNLYIYGHIFKDEENKEINIQPRKSLPILGFEKMLQSSWKILVKAAIGGHPNH